jgi:Transposase IS116/IS110/IS902 family
MTAALPELGRLRQRQISKLVGIAPLGDESGHRQGKRPTRDGREQVAVLCMAALVAIHHNPALRVLRAAARRGQSGLALDSEDRCKPLAQHPDPLRQTPQARPVILAHFHSPALQCLPSAVGVSSNAMHHTSDHG